MEKIRVLVADDVAETRENIRRLLYFEKDIEVVGEAEDGEEAVRMAEKLSPDVVLMDINMPVLDGIAATEMISLRVPTAAIVIMSVQGEQEYLKKAMMAGAREYLVKPFSSDELADTIRKVYQLEQKRRAVLAPTQAGTNERRDPKIITVFSTKGGVGKTTIAVNLAVALYQQTRKKVVLVDLDLQFGDVAIMLNVVPKRTISELVQEIAQLDSELLEAYLVSHSSGIKVLTAPLRPEYAELVTASHVEKILNLLKENYDYIVVDTPSYFQETTLTALDLSNLILLLVSLELPTIKNVKLALEILDTLHHKGKVKLVLNRSSSDIGVKCADMERSLNFQVAAHIPSDGRTVVAAVNKGIPFVISHPGSKIAEAIHELASLVIENGGRRLEQAAESKETKGILARLFG